MTIELQSSMPPSAGVRAASSLSIRRVLLCDHLKDTVTTHFTFTLGTFSGRLVGKLYSVDLDAVRGYLPTKILCAYEQLEALYYTNPSLPNAVRPFKEGKTHFLVIPAASVDMVVEYDMELRILIDQVVINNTIHYVVVFGDEQYHDVVDDYYGQ